MVREPYRGLRPRGAGDMYSLGYAKDILNSAGGASSGKKGGPSVNFPDVLRVQVDGTLPQSG